ETNEEKENPDHLFLGEDFVVRSQRAEITTSACPGPPRHRPRSISRHSMRRAALSRLHPSFPIGLWWRRAILSTLYTRLRDRGPQGRSRSARRSLERRLLRHRRRGGYATDLWHCGSNGRGNFHPRWLAWRTRSRECLERESQIAQSIAVRSIRLIR